MSKLTETAPERIWLQISDDEDDLNYPYPLHHEDVTWYIDSVVAAEVGYVRDDLLEAAQKRIAELEKDKVFLQGGWDSATAQAMQNGAALNEAIRRIAELEADYAALNHEYGLVVSPKYAIGLT